METITCPVCKQPVYSPKVFKDVRFSKGEDGKDKQEILYEFACDNSICGVVFRRVVSSC